MRISYTVALFRHEQPTEAAWKAADDYCRGWNAQSGPAMNELPNMWIGTFEAADHPAFERFVAGAERLARSAGVVFRRSFRTHLEPIDYEVADYVQLLGAGVGSEGEAFLLNEAEAIGAPVPCPACGAAGIFHAPQTAPYVIEERLLDRASQTEDLVYEGGWDVANMPNGHLLVSHAFVEVLEETGARGYRLEPVMARRQGRVSKRMVQLVAERAVLVPSPEYSRFDGQPPCPACGAGRGTLETYFWITREQAGGMDLLARHPAGKAIIHVSSRLRDALVAADLNGLHWFDVMRLCD